MNKKVEDSSIIQKILDFKDNHEEYHIETLYDKFYEKNEFWTVREGYFTNTSGLTHHVRLGVSPREGIYNIKELNDFMDKLVAETEINKKITLENSNPESYWNIGYNNYFQIYTEGLILKKKKFFRGNINVSEPINMVACKFPVGPKVNFAIKDKYLINKKSDEVKEVLGIENISEEIIPPEDFIKGVKNEIFEEEDIEYADVRFDRSISLRVFPDSNMMKITQDSDRQYMATYRRRELKGLIGKENAKKIFRSA